MTTNDDLAAVAEKAQRILAQTPTLLLGSGASVPYGLPTMGDLAKELVRSEPEMAEKGERSAWKRFKVQLIESGDLEAALHTAELPDTLVQEVVVRTWTFICERDLDLYRKLAAGEETLALTGLLRYLLRVANPRLHVITPNYDRVAEYAADAAGFAAYTGLSDGKIQSVDMTMPSMGRRHGRAPDGRRISVWKVHGSLDWFRRSNGTFVGCPLAWEIIPDSIPLIVTPGVSKYRETHQEPFRSIIAMADVALGSSTAFVCIGYGFNDEHLQPHLQKQVTEGATPILAITRTLTASAREFLLGGSCVRFLALERHDEGTIAYSPEALDGVILKGSSLWSLDDFVSTVTG